MPYLFEDDIKKQVEKQEVDSSQEQELISKLFRYTEQRMQPWRLDYNFKVLTECYNFRELRHWQGADMQMLALSDTPSVPIDRISRNLDTINGIRRNTGTTMKVVKREFGSDRIAELLDDVLDWVEDKSDFEDVYEDAFDSGMLTTGIGIVKYGFDSMANNGEGEFWAEHIPIEDFGYSKSKSKNLKDISWCWHKQMIDWDEAIDSYPDKASILKGLKAQIATEWESLKMNNVQGTFLTNDYGVATAKSEVTYSYTDQVVLWDFWVKRKVIYKKIAFIQNQPSMAPDGSMAMQNNIAMRYEQSDYQSQNNEQEIGTFVNDEWVQYIVATGSIKGGSGRLLFTATAEEPFPPFLAMCAERKKSGAPFGFIEKIIPHQKRINIAWAQKVAYNNKSIKTPLVLRGVTDVDSKLQQSKIGAVMNLTTNEEIVQMNIQPQINLQAIEEGNVARQDMDFIAAASEPVLMGAAEQGSSGVKLGMQQNAAVTPLNKWVEAEQNFKKEFGRRMLWLIIKYIPPMRMMKIIGEEKMTELLQPKVDVISGQITAPPIQLPFNPDVTEYDVTIEEKSISDFQKQQAFNAVMALKGTGIPFTDNYIIENSPITNVDDALESNKEARQDIMVQQQQQIQLQQILLQKQSQMQGKKSPANQQSNAQRGKNEPQAGQQSMMGGMGNSPLQMEANNG